MIVLIEAGYTGADVVDIEQFEHISLTLGLTLLIGWMVFIMWDLAKQSNAGRWGTIVLFTALGLGILGFVIKTIIVEVMSNG